MNRTIAAVAAVVFVLACAVAGAQSSAPARSAKDRMLDQIAAEEVKLGSDAWRAQMLAQSPRAHELVHRIAEGHRLAAYVNYPDGQGSAPVIVMVPEDQGLNNWARNMADQIAAMGYIVIVPDLLSGLGPNGGDRDSFPDIRSVIAAHSELPAHEAPLTAALNGWADYALKLPRANGRLGVIGFAWGGGRAFWFAVQRPALKAAFIFYDTAPPAAALAPLQAPVYGFYAQNDPRVTASLEATKASMAAAGKRYEAVRYPGSDHMFVRLGEEPGNTNPANIEARNRSLARLQELLRQELR